MQIQRMNLTIRDLVEGYIDDAEKGIRAYGGKLDVRPPYQREFVYKDKQRDAVIHTVKRGFPLNVMYWAVRADGTYEIIDGQQRTISICQYVKGIFSYKDMYFHSLRQDEQNKILDYELMIYGCSGADSEKLEWFKTINIAGMELAPQELRNAVYHGPWVTDAKQYFSKHGCIAAATGSDYMKGAYIRQEYLETAIKWISKGDIEGYMSKHHCDPTANELLLYFQAVIAWIQATFKVTRTKEMRKVDWGFLYDKYKDESQDTAKLESRIEELMRDSDVTKKEGIYPYVLTGEERYLQIRAFDDNMRREAYERQGGKCEICEKKFNISEMDADHITPWSEGGKTEADNCQMLCKADNRRKGAK